MTEVKAQTKNSISILHELCQKNGWKQPVERVVQETGTPNDKTFEIRFLLQFKFINDEIAIIITESFSTFIYTLLLSTFSKLFHLFFIILYCGL